MAAREVPRLVQHLRVRAPDQAAARHGAAQLQEALRCASLPDAGQRLLLVRRLALGAMPRGASPQGLTRWVEQGVQAAGWQWVDATWPEAANASAVVFENGLEAACELSRRLLTGPTPVEWFWPLAVPGFQPSLPRAQALWRVAQGLAQGPAGAVALQAWAARLRRWQLGAALAAQFTPEQAQALVRPTGVGAPSEPVAAIGAHTWVDQLAEVAEVAEVAGEVSERSGQALHAALGNAPDASPIERAAGAAGARWWANPAPLRPERHAAVALPSPTPKPTEPRAVTPASGLATSAAAAAPATAQRADQSDHAPAPVALPTPWLEPSRRAGLLFLLAVWQRLGLLEQADDRTVQQALWWALRGTRAPGEDPLVAWLRPPQPLSRRERVRACGWRRKAGRWLRRHARLGVAALVCRTGRVQVSSTHVDVHFTLVQADLRLRRHGLDVSLGWVPAWRRVLAIHFEGSR